MKRAKKNKYIHEGRYVAEIEVAVVENEGG